jgi:Ser-tRNA(Ala) deacylase AlaX
MTTQVLAKQVENERKRELKYDDRKTIISSEMKTNENDLRTKIFVRLRLRKRVVKVKEIDSIPCRGLESNEVDLKQKKLLRLKRQKINQHPHLMIPSAFTNL